MKKNIILLVITLITQFCYSQSGNIKEDIVQVYFFNSKAYFMKTVGDTWILKMDATQQNLLATDYIDEYINGKSVGKIKLTIPSTNISYTIDLTSNKVYMNVYGNITSWGPIHKIYKRDDYKKDGSLKVTLTSIKCVTENDGGGNAEEIFGKLFVQNSDGIRYYLFDKEEDANIEIDEGTSKQINTVAFFENLSANDIITVGGHLYEEDDGGDDDLGAQMKSMKFSEISDTTLRFSVDGTVIDVSFNLTKKKSKYLEIQKIRCIIPSTGVDGATNALVGVGIGVTSMVLAAGVVAVIVFTAPVSVPAGTVVSVATAAGAGVGNFGITTAFAPDYWTDLYVAESDGEDDVYCTMNGVRSWPEGEYTVMLSQDDGIINNIYPLDKDYTFRINEYDSASDDDFLGKYIFKMNGDYQLGVDMNKSIHDMDEGSTYVVYYRVFEK